MLPFEEAKPHENEIKRPYLLTQLIGLLQSGHDFGFDVPTDEDNSFSLMKFPSSSIS